VVAVHPTRSGDDCARVRVDVRIEPEDGPALVASQAITVAIAERPRPGQRVAISYDPRYPQRISIDLPALAADRSSAAPPGGDRSGNLERLASRAA